MGANLEDQAVRQSLLAFQESILGPSYVGSAHSDEAYRTAHSWLNTYQPSSADSFYQQVQAAVVEYAKIKAALDEGDR
jgi:hypothetical protein